MKIILFGTLSKNLGWKQKEIPWKKNMTPEEIWEKEINLNFKQVKPALNFEFCDWDAAIPKNSELAFLPPMSGG